MLKKELQHDSLISYAQYTWLASDGQELFAQKWDAGKSAKAAILLVHGFGEHSTRYTNWAIRLAKENISVLTFDIRGHGQTPGKQGNISDYNLLLNDIQLLVDKGKSEFKNIPLFLYGHSMGGNLVASYAITKNADLAGIILTSPWFELASLPPRIVISTILLTSKLMPWFIGKATVKPEFISRELREVHQYKTDPLIHNRISLGLVRSVYEKGIVAKRSVYKINSPLLVMHGSDDQITSCKASREFIRNASEKTTFVEWPGCYHELHHDIDRDRVFDKLVEWINQQIMA